MFWLTLQMWMLLAAFFLFGITSGWWIFRTRTQEAYSHAPINDEYDDYVNQRNQKGNETLDDSNKLLSPTQEGNPIESEESNQANTQSTDKEKTWEKTREKIYEKDLPDIQASDSQSENLADLPDMEIDMQDTPSTMHGENIDDNSDTTDSAFSKSAPPLYSAPFKGEANDLKKIKGIGKTLEKTLNGIGVYYYEQIASWSAEEVDWIDNQIDFPGRVRREKWVAQSSTLANEENSLAKEAAYLTEAKDIDALTTSEYDSNGSSSDSENESDSDTSSDYIKQDVLTPEQVIDTSSYQETIEGQASEVTRPFQTEEPLTATTETETPIESEPPQIGDDSLPESMLDRLRAKNKR